MNKTQGGKIYSLGFQMYYFSEKLALDLSLKS